MKINMKTCSPRLALANNLLFAVTVFAQCPGGVCHPTDQWVSVGAAFPALDSRPSTLDSSAHCRIRVGDGTVGSGTLIGKNDGTALVLTCSHLFDSSTSDIIVEFPDRSRFGARLVDRDQANDLAALLIQPPAAEPLAVDDEDVATSAVLTACGFGGDGRFRPARGAVTGAAQAIGATFPSLKIGSAVRPGDSGGGVLDTAGRVVGVVWGCRDGETYLTCGTPLRNFLAKVRGERASARGQTAPTLIPEAWRTNIESRLTNLDANKQNRGDYIQRDELTTLIANQSTRIEHSTESRINSLRSTLFDRIEERAVAVGPGLLGGLSYGKLAAGALGLSGPLALAVIAAGGLVGRRIKKQVHSASGSRPSTLDSRPIPIAVDSPPLPQRSVPESHYVPVQRDDFARAHQWAREQVARKYPGATEVLTTLESLIKQQLAGNNKNN